MGKENNDIDMYLPAYKFSTYLYREWLYNILKTLNKDKFRTHLETHKIKKRDDTTKNKIFFIP